MYWFSISGGHDFFGTQKVKCLVGLTQLPYYIKIYRRTAVAFKVAF